MLRRNKSYTATALPCLPIVCTTTQLSILNLYSSCGSGDMLSGTTVGQCDSNCHHPIIPAVNAPANRPLRRYAAGREKRPHCLVTDASATSARQREFGRYGGLLHRAYLAAILAAGKRHLSRRCCVVMAAVMSDNGISWPLIIRR